MRLHSYDIFRLGSSRLFVHDNGFGVGDWQDLEFIESLVICMFIASLACGLDAARY